MRNRLFLSLCFKRSLFTDRHNIPSLLNMTRYAHGRKNEFYKKRSMLFDSERKRQKESIGRIEKIEVHYAGVPKNTTLIMNKGISTPFNCAQHISEMLVKRSALALLDDMLLWDMHRPLQSSCELKLLHFKDHDPQAVNKAFWRTCSMMMGAVIQEVFKDDIPVILHSFPSPNVRSGSFIYDVELGLDAWTPTREELRVLSGLMVELAKRAERVERLAVDVDLALDMFSDNRHKSQQIPDIAAQSPTGREVVLYRMGQHVDISRGPLVGNTGLLGRCTVAEVHRLESCAGSAGPLYRFQGVALPQGLMLNHFAYSILENRACNLNPARTPASSLQPQQALAA